MPQILESTFVNPDLLNQQFDPDDVDSRIVPICAHFSKKEQHSLRAMMHSHEKGQLVFIKAGVATVQFADSSCFVYSNQMIWIPSGVFHNVTLCNDVEFRAVYFDQKYFPQLPKYLASFHASALLVEIIESMCISPFNTNWMVGVAYHLQSIVIQEIQTFLNLPAWPKLPNDSRIRKYLQQYYEKGEMVPRLNVLVSQCGASERTVHRLFVQSVGMSYQRWRQQVRLKLALDLLSTGKQITEIAHYLEFSTTSAFISFFKSYQNITPKKYQVMLLEHHDSSLMYKPFNYPEGHHT